MPPKRSQAAAKSALQEEDEPGPERPPSPAPDMLAIIVDKLSRMEARLEEQSATNNFIFKVTVLSALLAGSNSISPS